MLIIWLAVCFIWPVCGARVHLARDASMPFSISDVRENVSANLDLRASLTKAGVHADVDSFLQEGYEVVHSAVYAGAEARWEEVYKDDYGARKCDVVEQQLFERLFRTKLPTMSDLKLAIPNASSSGSILYLYPDGDENAAFAIEAPECYRILNWALKYQDVRLIHVSSIPEAMEILSLYPANSIQHLVVGGHGSTTSLSFNKHVSLGQLKIWDPYTIQFWELARSKLSLQATVFLDACLNGRDDKVEWNHLRFVARILPNHRVFASRISLTRRNTVIRDFNERFSVLVRDERDADGVNTGSVKNWVARGNCQDEPSDIVFPGNVTCEQLSEQGQCLSHGGVIGHRPYPDSSGQEVTARDACCKCGGGVRRNTQGTCPAWSAPVGYSGSCMCTHNLRCARGNGDSCPHGEKKVRGSFPANCTDCFCSKENACPAWAHGIAKHGNCLCKPGSQCRSSMEGGCPTRKPFWQLPFGRKSPELSLKMFSPSCKDCVCETKVSHMHSLQTFAVNCTGDACMCQEGTRCFKGDREGQCPQVGFWGKGEVGRLSERFDARCSGCECRMPCSRDAATPFSIHGICDCVKPSSSVDFNTIRCHNGTQRFCEAAGERRLYKYDASCKDCECRYLGPWKIGQRVKVCFDPCQPDDTYCGTVASLMGGEVKVLGDKFTIPFSWDKVFQSPELCQ